MYRGFFSDYRLNVVGEIIDMIVKSKGTYKAKIEKKNYLITAQKCLKALVISKILLSIRKWTRWWNYKTYWIAW